MKGLSHMTTVNEFRLSKLIIAVPGAPKKWTSQSKTNILVIFPCGKESEISKIGSGKYSRYRVTTPGGKSVENASIRDMKRFIECDYQGAQFYNRKILRRMM
jgi:hypothetical protein